MTWTDTDLAYFAGIIDGEGNFCLHNQGTHVFTCSLSGIGQRNKHVPVMREAAIEHRQALHAKMAVLNKRGA